ncbi:uncharacterized protein B0H18DRAFT_952036 [Fomitopsis serialis]|uniref:uncharacterized protein n=1 Tax=Fomitopsis serialis TaxID=139415 RepID=UPI002008B14D|nr:uncharacterized protein B0H18DRAFT_952036 [Neoantrodia serialis]KAH9933518.1 hypothetical protein B0H18DRAFT_952036 [Neoantrodia serialis]
MPILRVNLDPTMGGIFIGALFSAMFYGFTCAQVVHYSRNYHQHDKVFVKILALVLITGLRLSAYGLSKFTCHTYTYCIHHQSRDSDNYLSSIDQDKMIWAIFHCAGGKIYVNSMMAVLNARKHLKGGVSHVSGFTEDASRTLV